MAFAVPFFMGVRAALQRREGPEDEFSLAKARKLCY